MEGISNGALLYKAIKEKDKRQRGETEGKAKQKKKKKKDPSTPERGKNDGR